MPFVSGMFPRALDHTGRLHHSSGVAVSCPCLCEGHQSAHDLRTCKEESGAADLRGCLVPGPSPAGGTRSAEAGGLHTRGTLRVCMSF